MKTSVIIICVKTVLPVTVITRDIRAHVVLASEEKDAKKVCIRS